MRKNHVILAVAVIISAMLACNMPSNTPNQPNPDAVLTAAALTVQAQLTTSAATLSAANTATSAPSANTPTFTPVPLSTSTSVPVATATSSCDSAQFMADVSYPDNTPVPAGTVFNKIWKLKNTGTCTWTPSYAIVFSSGEQMGGPTTQALTGNVNPGQTVDVSIFLTAPSTTGTHTGYWILRNATGATFHSNFYVQIKVTGGGGGGGGSGPFAVTSVSFNGTGSCGNFHITVNITTNGAGTVNYHRIWSDGGTDSLPGTFIYSAAGTKSVTYDSSTSSSGWMDIYIDSPNHQQFSRATYPCP